MQAVGLTETQQDILDAAATVVVEDGLTGLKLRRVAAEADVSLGLLGYHFKGKQALLEATFDDASSRWLDAYLKRSTDGATAADQLARLVQAPLSDESLRPGNLGLRLALMAAARTEPGLAAIEQRLHERYEVAVCEALAGIEAEGTPEDHRDRAVDVMALQDGVLWRWARAHNEIDLERCRVLCLELATGSS